jgi:hypothetical protein
MEEIEILFYNKDLEKIICKDSTTNWILKNIWKG